MSDKAWYEGLTGDDFFGKHLQVHMTNGVIYTGPVLADDCLVAMNLCGESRSILERESATSEWRKSPSVVSVSLLWDERDWEQIRTEDISKADAIVVNGRLYQVAGSWANDEFHTDDQYIPQSFVSCALRSRAKLPTKPGYYKSRDGKTMLLRLHWVHPRPWIVVSDDLMTSNVYATDDKVRGYLPLSPVHFVDGRAE